MPEPRRSAWSALADDWDPENPALVRMRLALEAATRPPEPPQAAEPVEVAAEPVPLDLAEEIESLTARVRAGDRSVLERLRRLLGR